MHPTDKLRSAHFVRFLALGLLAAPALTLPASEPADALSDDPPTAERAIASLRTAGQAGVDRLLAAAPELLGSKAPAALRERFARALDRVCAQRDCAASGLFWHTDLEAARAAAARTGRPILSLRLLGRLDQDRSCANSRFFRTVLYPDPRVAALLRAAFVLHWSSERPVPALTIDFGDGRVLEGTITGNSVHYVLDAAGRVVDALPGLYGPGLFVDRLREAAGLAQRLGHEAGDRFVSERALHHLLRAAVLENELSTFLDGQPGRPRSAAEAAREAEPEPQPQGGAGPVSTARLAGSRAVTKAVSEMPVVDAMFWTLPGSPIDDGTWRLLAESRPDAWRLSDASRTFLVRKHGVGEAEARERVLAAFEAVLAIDAMRNEYQLHAEIHRWLAGASGPDPGFDAWNARVYGELFLTPASDPWLGLVSADTYLALDTPDRYLAPTLDMYPAPAASPAPAAPTNTSLAPAPEAVPAPAAVPEPAAPAGVKDIRHDLR